MWPFSALRIMSSILCMPAASYWLWWQRMARAVPSRNAVVSMSVVMNLPVAPPGPKVITTSGWAKTGRMLVLGRPIDTCVLPRSSIAKSEAHKPQKRWSAPRRDQYKQEFDVYCREVNTQHGPSQEAFSSFPFVSGFAGQLGVG